MSNNQRSICPHGAGAIAQVSKRFLHPSKLIDDKYPNTTGDYKVEGLIEVRREVKTVNRREQMCIVFHHKDFQNVELHAVERWVKVTSSATSTFITSTDTIQEHPTETEQPTDNSKVPGDTINDAHQYLRKGFLVDDDTLPTDDNRGPTNTTKVNYTGWGWDGINPHCQGNNQRSRPIFKTNIHQLTN